jgi:hypothetical protein
MFSASGFFISIQRNENKKNTADEDKEVFIAREGNPHALVQCGGRHAKQAAADDKSGNERTVETGRPVSVVCRRTFPSGIQ